MGARAVHATFQLGDWRRGTGFLAKFSINMAPEVLPTLNVECIQRVQREHAANSAKHLHEKGCGCLMLLELNY